MQKSMKYILYIAAAFVIFLLVKKYLGKKKDEKGDEGNSGGGGGGGANNIPTIIDRSTVVRQQNRGTRYTTSAANANSPYVSPRNRR